MQLSERQTSLLEFIKLKHKGQFRKYTGDAYWTHPFSVAERVSVFHPSELAIEIALCHDLFEDTSCTEEELKTFLKQSYSSEESYRVISVTKELTDVYTKEKFPDLNRSERKKKEIERLSVVSKNAQTIKYADICDNIISIAMFDHDFAKTYIEEKKNLLKVMTGNYDFFDGHTIAFIECSTYIKCAQDIINFSNGKSN